MSPTTPSSTAPPPPPQQPPQDYRSILTLLLSNPSSSPSSPTPTSFPLLSLPTSPHHPRHPSLTHPITNLSLHPTLESALHILNLDLPAAHFLLRHMQDPAKCPEAALLHGILHRIEGDVENARAWYRSAFDAVGEGGEGEGGVFGRAWPGEGGREEAFEFLDRVEGFRKEGRGDGEGLRRRSLEEIEAVVGFCEERFGVGRVEDASRGVWVGMGEEHRRMAGDMVVGGEGWREF